MQWIGHCLVPVIGHQHIGHCHVVLVCTIVYEQTNKNEGIDGDIGMIINILGLKFLDRTIMPQVCCR